MLPRIYVFSQPPPHWPDLFQHSSINLLQDDPDVASTISLGPEWTAPEGVSSISEGVPTLPTTSSRETDPATAQHDAIASPTPIDGDPAVTPTDTLASPQLSSSDLAGAQHDAPTSAASLPPSSQNLPELVPALANQDIRASGSRNIADTAATHNDASASASTSHLNNTREG
jgi:hypothetical protein